VSHEPFDALVPVYAVGALDGADLAQFEAHLPTCAACQASVRDAEESFMDEPRFQNNHRGNILDPKYTDVGIGIVQAPDGNLYITQDFAAITPERGAGSSR